MPDVQGQPLFIIEILDATIRALVEENKAECLHDGSQKFVPFKGSVPIKSKRFSRVYDIYTTPGTYLTAYRARIKLVFDKTINRGEIRVSNADKAMLDKIGFDLLSQSIETDKEESPNSAKSIIKE